jgi:hypothetical protein
MMCGVKTICQIRSACACAVLSAAFWAGCGDEERNLDRTPERLDGSSSQEFEADDIEAAENASDAVQEYCSGAVSEAQRIGCESHVDESEIP